ncbi:MAG: hypothetical protein MZV64_62495 [Ignavibacteriales bacterium]|nr:hypothetical protein [Ignavibacteriales bacterium]
MAVISRTDVFAVAQYLNILTFGLTIWLAGRFFRKLFPENVLYAVHRQRSICHFAFVDSAWHRTSFRTLMFLALTIAFLIAATDFIENPSRKNGFALGWLCAVSPLLALRGTRSHR